MYDVFYGEKTEYVAHAQTVGTRVEDPSTSDPVPVSTSVSTPLLLQRLKHFRFDHSTFVATEVLLNVNILSETATVQTAPPERGLYLVC